MFEEIRSQQKDFDVLGFGEVMLRLSPTGKERIAQSEQFEKMVGGSELNVVSGISLLGLRTGLITKLPANEIGKFAKNRIRFCNVSDDMILYDDRQEARLGIYYSESGAYPRKPTVVYDRANSSINSISIDEIPEEVYKSTRIFHVSGISLALSKQVCQVVIEMIKRFKEHGVLISFDVNYRATLWDEETARETILSLLPYLDILFISEETSRRMMQRTGTLEEIMKGYCRDYNIKIVASTIRTVLSPTHHAWDSKIYSSFDNTFYSEPGYQNIEVVDRIGSGDAYLAGVLFGLLKYNDLQQAVEYGNAMAAIKNTIPGDMPVSDFDEITKVIKGHKGIGPVSEMNR